MRPLVVGLALLFFYFVTTADRQNVAAAEAAATLVTDPRPNNSLLDQLGKKSFDGIASLQGLAAQLQQFDAANNQQPDYGPGPWVWVRLSKGYLADHVQRDVDRVKPVRDVILGTRIYGESHTTGRTRLILHPSDNDALGEIEFSGHIQARGTGYNGPATLQYRWTSTFHARKRLTIGDSGLVASPAVARASTRLTPVDISTNRPGLRGRIIERIAWRRVANTRAQADAIASNHTARDIRNDLDGKVNDSLAATQTKLRSQLAALQLEADEPLVVRSRSTPDYVEVALYRGDAAAEEVLPVSPIEADSDIAIRFHRSFLARAWSNPELREKVVPLLGRFSAGGAAASETKNAATSPVALTNWSMGAEWIGIDLAAPQKSAPPPRLAADDDLQPTPLR